MKSWVVWNFFSLEILHQSCSTDTSHGIPLFRRYPDDSKVQVRTTRYPEQLHTVGAFGRWRLQPRNGCKVSSREGPQKLELPAFGFKKWDKDAGGCQASVAYRVGGPLDSEPSGLLFTEVGAGVGFQPPEGRRQDFNI